MLENEMSGGSCAVTSSRGGDVLGGVMDDVFGTAGILFRLWISSASCWLLLPTHVHKFEKQRKPFRPTMFGGQAACSRGREAFSFPSIYLLRSTHSHPLYNPIYSSTTLDLIPKI